MTEAIAADPERRRFLLLSLALCLVGFALRETYLLVAIVERPVSGDSLEYWRYAWNLVNHGVFSVQPPSATTPSPDSWRGPGFPALLALCLRAGEDSALMRAQQMLVLMGSALVPLSIALGRFWLSRQFALLAGALVAFWPHLVVFSSATMSETPFALGLVAAALALALADRRQSPALACLAGLVAGLAVLVNPVFQLFPLVCVALLLLRGKSRLALAYGLAFALLAGGWSLRNATLPPGRGAAERVQENLVQGSWPLFQAAWNNRATEPMAAAYMRQVEQETARMRASPAAGLADMAARFRSAPGPYLRWYLLDKPFLLWDWSILIGPGDIYMFPTSRSLFERVPLLHGWKLLARALNPLLFFLALTAAGVSAWRIARRRAHTDVSEAALGGLGLLFFYVTAVHTVLQAEPRYGIAYRPIEFLLAATALSWGLARLRARKSAE